MTKQSFEESADIQAGDIPSPQLKVEGPTPPFRRYGQSTDGRDTILFVKMVIKGRLPFGRPSPRDVRNEQEARFIEEDQMGPKSVGVFLYGANGTVSNEQSLPRFFVTLVVPVSGSSTPTRQGASRRDWDGMERQTLGQSSGLPGLGSTNRFDTQKPEGHSRALGQDDVFGFRSALEDGRASDEALFLEHLFPGRPEATGTLNSQKPSKLVRWLAGSSPLWTNGWPADAAFPAALAFHGVACSPVYTS